MIANLDEGIEYKIWAKEFVDGNKLYTANYTPDAPVLVRADTNITKTFDINYTSSDIKTSNITLKFHNIPTNAVVDVKSLQFTISRV